MLQPVESLEITVPVDNGTDSLSTNPGFVETEMAGAWRRGMKWLSGRCLCCAAHCLSCLITTRTPSSQHTLLFDTGPDESIFERGGYPLAKRAGSGRAMVKVSGRRIVLTRSQQRHTVAACFLSWTLDAFDFFIMVFLLAEIAKEFGAGITPVTIAITVTLATRPLGALLFGYMADRFGRRIVLIVNVLIFTAFEFVSGLAQSLAAFIVIRALFGVAMGGEWGVGASLTMESIPAKWRGAASGLLQAGYPCGYLLASLLYWVVFSAVGWRMLFMIGAVPGRTAPRDRRFGPAVDPDYSALGLLRRSDLSRRWRFLDAVPGQGCFGVVPAHLNELSPPEVRGTFPGFVYQFGNFLAAGNATIQSLIADRMNHNYSVALAVVPFVGAIVIAGLVGLGREGRDVKMGGEAASVQ
jgi:MFS family permease